MLGFMQPALMQRGPSGSRAATSRSRCPTPSCARKLTPRYRMGCKRMLISNDYYPRSSRTTSSSSPTRIAEVREHSIVTRDGTEHAVDTIIFGTGFHVIDLPIGDRVRGVGGRTLAEALGRQPAGAPRAPRSPASRTSSCCSAPTPASGTPRSSS